MARKTPGEKLMSDLQSVVEDAEALLQATAAQTGERVDGVRARARESLKQARSRLVEVEGRNEGPARDGPPIGVGQNRRDGVGKKRQCHDQEDALG